MISHKFILHKSGRLKSRCHQAIFPSCRGSRKDWSAAHSAVCRIQPQWPQDWSSGFLAGCQLMTFSGLCPWLRATSSSKPARAGWVLLTSYSSCQNSFSTFEGLYNYSAPPFMMGMELHPYNPMINGKYSCSKMCLIHLTDRTSQLTSQLIPLAWTGWLEAAAGSFCPASCKRIISCITSPQKSQNFKKYIFYWMCCHFFLHHHEAEKL